MNLKHITFLLLLTLSGAGLKAQNKADLKTVQLIRLSNAVIKLSNLYLDKYEEYNDMLKYGNRLYEQLKNNADPQPVTFAGSGSFPVDLAMYIEYDEAMADIPNKTEEKQLIAAAVKTAKEHVVSLEKWGKDMKRYFESRTFDRDRFLGYFIICDSLEHYLHQTRSAWKAASRTASEAGEEAEMKLLKKKPLAPFIIPMKNDMKSSRNILNDLYDMAIESSPDYIALKTSLNIFRSYLDRHRDLSRKNISSIAPHITFYVDYYNKMDRLADMLDALLNELLQANRNVDRINALYRDVDRCHNEAVDSFNDFVRTIGRGNN
jgi:hypothetical protein